MITLEQYDSIGFSLEDQGLTHSQIDAYFEHFGAKGMKWGVRKAASAAKATGSAAKSTGKFVKEHKKGIAVGLGAAALGGAAIAAVILSNRSGVRASTLEKNKQALEINRSLAMNILNKKPGLTFADLHKMNDNQHGVVRAPKLKRDPIAKAFPKSREVLAKQNQKDRIKAGKALERKLNQAAAVRKAFP